MQVILLEPVGKLGRVGDIVTVRDGYARNFLIPLKKVLRATEQNKAYFEAKRASIEAENATKRAAAENESKNIADVFVTITRQVGDDGRLYGSVNARDIAQALIADGKKVDRRLIQLQQPIKTLGVQPVKVVLHPEVIIEVRVNVARNLEDAAVAKEEFLNPALKEERERKAKEAEAREEAERTEAALAKISGKKKKSRHTIAGEGFAAAGEEASGDEAA